MTAAAFPGDYSTAGAQRRGHEASLDTSIRPATDGVARVIFRTPRMHARSEIDAGGRTYTLAAIFLFELEPLEEGGFFASDRTLPVNGWGESPRQAIAALCDAFGTQYCDLVEAPEATLSPGALTHRVAFEALVARITPVDAR